VRLQCGLRRSCIDKVLSGKLSTACWGRLLIPALSDDFRRRNGFVFVAKAPIHQGFDALSLFWRENQLQLFSAVSRMNFQGKNIKLVLLDDPVVRQTS
jgi:hypothetical protein